MKRIATILIVWLVSVGMAVGTVSAKKPSLDNWKPDFDPSGAKYKCIISNVSHPAIKGVYAGFAIRDELWKRSNGQIYVDFKPFSLLGGEVEVLNLLQMGAIQGMACSSVASTNLGPRFGLVNLPFLVDSYGKLEKFVANKDLFNHFLRAMDHQGIMGLNITTYGSYGWASTTPVRNLADTRKAKFRIAEAAVNQLTYKQWGINPVPMPWPDVPIALKQGVITALDHTDLVCDLTKKFEICKYYTQISYAQGLFIWVFNKAWFSNLPSDLQKIFTDVVNEVCAQYRKEGQKQAEEIVASAKAKGVEFIKLSDADMAILRQKGDAVHQKYAKEINMLYPGDSYRSENFLKDVQDSLGYRP